VGAAAPAAGGEEASGALLGEQAAVGETSSLKSEAQLGDGKDTMVGGREGAEQQVAVVNGVVDAGAAGCLPRTVVRSVISIVLRGPGPICHRIRTRLDKRKQAEKFKVRGLGDRR
jgi:hypothetical protein